MPMTDLARLANIAPAQLVRIENGSVNAGEDQLQSIAVVLRVDIEDLL